jgi:ketosteroid isomerase-like protein
MKEQENVQVVQEIYAAFQRGDIETVLKPLADDVQWWVAGSTETFPYAGTRTGREQVAQFFSTLGEMVEYERFEPYEYIAQGDQVVALGRDRRRFKSTDNVIENEWAMVFTLRQGEVAAFRAYDDTEACAVALCAAPQAVASGV